MLALTPKAVVSTDYAYGHGPDNEALVHRVTVRHVYRESADDALRTGIGELLPLVPVMQPSDGDHAALLSRVVARILALEVSKDQQTMMLEQTAHFATLHLPRDAVDGIVQNALRRGPNMLYPLRDFPYAQSVFREGEARGIAKGKAEGIAEGKAESVLTILSARGVRVTKALRGKILACADADTLDQWLRRAASATTAADVLGTKN